MDLLFPLLILVLLVPMFLAVRRQRKEVAASTAMQAALQVGDRVVTTSGLYGTITHVDDESVDLEIAEDVITTWLRAAIREVRKDDSAPVEDAAAGGESPPDVSLSKDAGPTAGTASSAGE